MTECRWDRRRAEISYRARVVLTLLSQAQSSAWTAKQESNFPVTLTSFKSRAVESGFHSLTLNNPPHIITVHSLYQQVLLSAPVSTDPALGSSQTTVKRRWSGGGHILTRSYQETLPFLLPADLRCCYVCRAKASVLSELWIWFWQLTESMS